MTGSFLSGKKSGKVLINTGVLSLIELRECFQSDCIFHIGGEGKTTAEMKRQATYVGWDFTKIWRIKEGQTYPFFLWQPSPPKIENPIPQ